MKLKENPNVSLFNIYVHRTIDASHDCFTHTREKKIV